MAKVGCRDLSHAATKIWAPDSCWRVALCGTGSTARLVPNRGKERFLSLYCTVRLRDSPDADVIGLMEKNLAYNFVS
jgi:hypothetical protein